MNDINLQKSPGGDVVTILADEPMTYELFDLKAPARLVVNIPGASLKKGLEPLHDDHPGVNSVFPVVSGDGVRLEIGMDRVLAYQVDEKGKKLVVRFAATVVTGKKSGAGSAAVLKDIDIRDRGSVTELILRGDHMNANHDAFITNKGRTLILDFWGATSMLPKEHYAVSTQKVSGITVGQAEGRVRLVVNLIKGGQQNHQIDAGAQQMVVRFGGVAAKRRAAVLKVEEVHFQPDDRVAHLQIRTDATNPIVNIYEKQGNVVLDIKKAALASGQQRTQDVRDFPGPIKQVDAYTVGDQVRIVARLREKVDVSSFQQGNVLTLTLVPKGLAAARRGVKGGEKFAYTGQKVTFDFKDIDIRNALKLIAEMSDLNIIMSDDVSGKMTMRLVDVPWDQALDLILSARGLGKERQGNVMRIAPTKVLVEERQNRLEALQGSEQLEPLVTEFITLSYARVKDVKKMLSGASANSTKGGGASGGSTGGAAPAGASSSQTTIGILSPRGSFLVDERTNTLIIKDTKDSVNNIKRLIATIDKPVEQVLITARIVEATDNFSRELGVSWGGQVTGRGGNVKHTLGSRVQDPLVPNTGINPGGFLVDLPAVVGTGAGGIIGFSIGALNNAFNLDLELSAAEADKKIKILSNPRVVTTNLKTATIDSGKDVPFETVSQNGTQVQFKKATLGLEVTPQITADKRVILHVVVTKDSVLAPVGTSTNPVLSTKKVDTEIFMDNGETIVIGGVYTRDRQVTTNGIPGLSKIPVLGWLFKKKFRQDNKTELLIFLTPKILESRPGQGTSLAESS
ncbi:MAG: type IV pilus secretin PilQ [Mariprofundaceae bacterium]|nr:type IV pilus secretin PilQ [Mariprofundaceae bacterium]